ncbi:3'-5' exonuclease, partial [Enterococcus faecalis]
ASIQMKLRAIGQTQPGDYTERIVGLDNRSLYVTKEK